MLSHLIKKYFLFAMVVSTIDASQIPYREKKYHHDDEKTPRLIL
jgi:hypothetical protein